jgi:LmbE family N-acetylglucosaminyl deacetylase
MFVGASSDAERIEAAFRAGANHQLTKPIDPQDVLTQILGYTSAVDLDRAPTVLALGARPGDVEMGCGGILCKHRSEGHRIAIVNLAGGGDPDSDLAEASRVAAELLDATVTNFGDESHRIPDLDKAMSAFQDVLGTSKPGMLYIPTLSSDRPSSIQIHRIAVGLADAVPHILAYQDPGATVGFHPRLFIDLAPQIDYKLELVEVYDEFDFRNVSTDLVKATALYWGRFTRSSRVEPLEIIRRGHV